MNSYNGYGSGTGSTSTADKAQMMDQLKNQIAVANAQELVQVRTIEFVMNYFPFIVLEND